MTLFQNTFDLQWSRYYLASLTIVTEAPEEKRSKRFVISPKENHGAADSRK